MAKFLQTYASDGSVQEIIQLPASLELLLDNAADLPVNFATPTRQTFSVVEGASANVATWVAPFKCRVVAAGQTLTIHRTQATKAGGDVWFDVMPA